MLVLIFMTCQVGFHMFFFAHDEATKPQRELPADVQALLSSKGLTWGQVETLLEALRREKPDLSVGALQVFLYIARRTGVPRSQLPYVKTVSADLCMHYSTVARHCDVLAEGVGGSGGLGLIEKIDDPTSRVKHLALADAGVALLAGVLTKGSGV